MESFLISKKIIKKVGWFDERLLGIGHENGDYMLRMTILGIMLPWCDARGIKNFVAPQENAGWMKISDISDGKYSKINKEFIKKKWDIREVPKDKLHPHGVEAKLRSGMETPLFYDFKVLDIAQEFVFTPIKKPRISFIQRLRMAIESIYGSSRLFIRKVIIKSRERKK